MSFIPQHDSHIENLTVKETLIYASKLKNNERAKELIKQNNQDNSQETGQDSSSNATISLANTSPTNLTSSSIDTIYSGSNSSSISLNVPSPVDSSSVESNLVSNLVNHHASHLAGAVNHLAARRLSGASVHNVNLNRLETQTNSSSHSDRTAASVLDAGDALELPVNLASEKQSPILLNFTHIDQYHDYLVNQIIAQLMLDTCAQTFVSKCSGGQLKRLSIAIELLSEPKVIIMDEVFLACCSRTI